MTRRKIVLYIATSLDGYIARENGDISWLDEFAASGDYGYETFLATVDTLIMGRTTYEQVLTFGEWPYAGKKCYVLSDARTGSDGRVEFVGGDVAALAEELRRHQGRDIWLVGGAATADAFIKAGLVDEYIITVIPVMLGDGIALFKKHNPPLRLTLTDLRRLPGEMVQVYYAPKRPL